MTEPDPSTTTQPSADASDPATSIDTALGGERLPCGALVDELLEQVAERRGGRLTVHQQQCPHCQAALTEFSRLWAPIEEHAATNIPIPTALAAGVMTSIRTLVRDVWYTLDVADGGTIRVAARVVAVLARDAARRVPGVRVALGRTTASRMAQLVEKATLGHRHPHAAVGVLGRTAAVDLALAVSYGPPLKTIGDQVQRAVIAELRRSIGLTGVVVNVTIDDIYT